MLTTCAIEPNSGPRIAPRTAKPNAVPISSPRRARGVATVSQASAPAHVVVLEKPCTNRESPSVHGEPGQREGEARGGEQQEAAEHRPPRPEPRRRDPARDPAEKRAGAERADQQAGAGLREVELVRVARHERDQRAEQHRVDEDDRADEDEQAAHPTEATGGCVRDQKIHRAGCAFVLRPDGLSASAYGLPEWDRPTRVPCSVQGAI